MTIDLAVFWSGLAAVAAALGLVGGFVLWLGRSFKRRFDQELEAVRSQNENLRHELDTRLRVPSFGLDAVRLTELAAKRRIEELETKLNSAVVAKDDELVRTMEEQKGQIVALSEQFTSLQAARLSVQQKLQSAIVTMAPVFHKNSVGLPTGPILLVKHADRYGALQALEQAKSDRGAFIRYAWWYQPDGETTFLNERTQFGHGDAGEKRPGSPPMLRIGPITLEWSVGGEGHGWVYYGPSSSPSPDYELAITNHVSISAVDAQSAQFHSPEID